MKYMLETIFQLVKDQAYRMINRKIEARMFCFFLKKTKELHIFYLILPHQLVKTIIQPYILN
jgi:hypothetical protein